MFTKIVFACMGEDAKDSGMPAAVSTQITEKGPIATEVSTEKPLTALEARNKIWDLKERVYDIAVRVGAALGVPEGDIRTSIAARETHEHPKQQLVDQGVLNRAADSVVVDTITNVQQLLNLEQFLATHKNPTTEINLGWVIGQLNPEANADSFVISALENPHVNLASNFPKVEAELTKFGQEVDKVISEKPELKNSADILAEASRVSRIAFEQQL